MGSLLDHWSHVDRLVPPSGLANRLVGTRLWSVVVTTRTYVSSVGSHDGEVVVMDDLLHLLNTSKVSQHVSNGYNVTVLDELLSDLFGGRNCAGSDGLSLVVYTVELTFSMK